MDSLKVAGEKCLQVRQLVIRNQLKPAHLLNTHFRDKKRDMNMSQEADDIEDDLFEQKQVVKDASQPSQDGGDRAAANEAKHAQAQGTGLNT